jgi:PAS domain S-box-containing protein
MLKDMAGKKLAVGLKKSDATGQWQTSDEQTESELRLGLVTETEPLGWIDYKPHTGELSLDGCCRAILGLKPDDQPDMNVFYAGVHPADLPKVRAAIESVFNKETSGRLEIEYRLKPKESSPDRWVRVTGRSFLGENSDGIHLDRLVGVVQDITDHKQQEMKLGSLETKFRDIVKYAPLGIYEFDFKGPHFRSVNDVMCHYLGYSREELLAMNPLDLLDDRCAAIVRDRVTRRLAEQTVDNSIEIKVTAKDGRIYYAIVYIILTYTDGKPDGAIVIAHDVTERKKAEFIIKENESRAATLLEITQTFASVGFNSKQLLDVIARRTAEVLGDSCDIAMVSEDGQWLKSEAFHHNNPESMNMILDRFMGIPCRVGEGLPGKVVETGAPKRIPVIIPGRTRDGGGDAYESLADICPVHSVMIAPLRVCGRVIGTISVFRHSPVRPYNKSDQSLLQDIADRAALSIENARLFEVMEREVAVRKRAEKELLAAKQQAELYLDLMSHDINNMHLVALGYLEMARDRKGDGRQIEFIDKPISVLKRSSQLINNVMKLQMLKDGLIKTELVDAREILAEVEKEYGDVPNKTVKFNTHGIDRCQVRANELLYDVFSNLVSNAVKHTGNSTAIAIDLERIEEDGNAFFRIAVEDDGPGIHDDLKGAVFNRTTRGNTMVKGMGLGLYLVKSLVDCYGGSVWVEDRVPGDHTKGARFVVLLPAVDK